MRHVVACLARCCNGLLPLRHRIFREDELSGQPSYGEALSAPPGSALGLHGTPTYRVAHHPNCKAYFTGAGGGLNTALQNALLVAAPDGRRRIYTRLVRAY